MPMFCRKAAQEETYRVQTSAHFQSLTERGRRSDLKRVQLVESEPPAPFMAPVAYQEDQVRQAVAKLSETVSSFDPLTLNAMLRKLPRRGTDPVYEPLHVTAVGDGMAALIENGELRQGEQGRYEIPARTPPPT